MTCYYKEVFGLGVLASLFIFYIAYVISIIIQERIQKVIK
ncbi:hypothetical protein ES703_45643 [subsurface metagenome]